MINQQLLNPSSIAVIGGSNDVSKPGGKILKNIIDGNYQGELRVVNPKEEFVQGIRCYPSVQELPDTDLAILAIAARHCPDAVEVLANSKNTKAFIILSAGFSEESKEGAALEQRIAETINKVNGALIGPNCIGIMTPAHHSVFTLPIPELIPEGIDFVSGSGATACFILEAAIPKGLRFANIISVGNSAQIGIEEVLEYFDLNFDPVTSSKIKLLYVETIRKPQKLLRHARSLIRKGCRIGAIKAGASEAGSRAASSHTGAMASPDVAVDALFSKAGIVRCYGREELVAVASVFMHKPLQGRRFAIITHAGGPAVMLTDALSNGGMQVPQIESPKARELLEKLHPGSSVNNPIDFLATGTAQQLGLIMDYTEKYFHETDAMIVIFGTPGLFPIFDVYDVLHRRMEELRKPVFPVLPSTLTAREEVQWFIKQGHVIFTDEVVLGNALAKVYNTPEPAEDEIQKLIPDTKVIRNIIDVASNGFLAPGQIQAILDAAGISRVKECVVTSIQEVEANVNALGFPVVMKAVGPIHKSDVGGVVLNIQSVEEACEVFNSLMRIKDTTGVLIQPMLRGRELFAGASYEPGFGHMLMCGLGGIFIEILKDVQTALIPVARSEAVQMLSRLKGRRIFDGVRGKSGINKEAFIEIILRLSALIEIAPEIAELDLNPLLGTADQVVAVDARIRIDKSINHS